PPTADDRVEATGRKVEFFDRLLDELDIRQLQSRSTLLRNVEHVGGQIGGMYTACRAHGPGKRQGGLTGAASDGEDWHSRVGVDCQYQLQGHRPREGHKVRLPPNPAGMNGRISPAGPLLMGQFCHGGRWKEPESLLGAVAREFFQRDCKGLLVVVTEDNDLDL